MTPLMKWLLGIVAVALIAWVAYMYGQQSASNKSADTNSVKATPSLYDRQAEAEQLEQSKQEIPQKLESTTKRFQSKLINLAFEAPINVSYAEFESFGDDFTNGMQVDFRDSTKTAPNFDATTTDYKISDTVPHDLLPNIKILDSSVNFKSAASYELGEQSRSKVIAPGMHLVAGYNSIEGTFSFPLYLLIEPPKDSGLKYISFYLGDSVDELVASDVEKDKDDLDRPTEAVIKRVVTLGLNDQNLLFEDTLAQAIAIAKTFTTK